MNESVYTAIQEAASYLQLDIDAQEAATYAMEHSLDEESLQAILDILGYLKDKKQKSIVSMLLRLSRLPLKEPKTFQNFDFNLFHGKQKSALAELSTLSALYAHRNLAFIGPQGVGKTHLAMAYGRSCCERGFKAYFMKATELNQRLTEARRIGSENRLINSLIKHSCLIIDEVGRCVFDKENTRLFFDIIDRRYNKEGPNTMIFTSNISPDKWGEYFSESSTLLCAMDRIFDNAVVFTIKGSSYRGRRCETVSLSTGEISTVINK